MAIQHAFDGRSASLSHDGNTYVPAECKIRCLRDQIIVEPLDVPHSNVLAIVEHTKPVRGVVKAVGPGHYPKRYDHPDKHKRSKMWESKTFRPIEVQVGDVVELGGIEFGGYSFQTFLWGDKIHLICREADVSLIDEGAAPFWSTEEIEGVKKLARATLNAAIAKDFP
jgi:hypothetical protein